MSGPGTVKGQHVAGAGVGWAMMGSEWKDRLDSNHKGLLLQNFRV